MRFAFLVCAALALHEAPFQGAAALAQQPNFDPIVKQRMEAVEAERKKNEPALTLAERSGYALGQALSCYSISRGDVRYAQDVIEARLKNQYPKATSHDWISRRFQAGLTAGQRATAGSTDYDCPSYDARARALVIEYGGRLH